jgi:hypothetical protein
MKRIILVGMASLLVSGGLLGAGLSEFYAEKGKADRGELSPFTTEELKKMTVFDPKSCKSVAVSEIVGKKAYDKFNDQSEKDGWFFLIETDIKPERGDLVLVKRSDGSATYGLLFNRRRKGSPEWNMFNYDVQMGDVGSKTNMIPSELKVFKIKAR